MEANKRHTYYMQTSLQMQYNKRVFKIQIDSAYACTSELEWSDLTRVGLVDSCPQTTFIIFLTHLIFVLLLIIKNLFSKSTNELMFNILEPTSSQIRLPQRCLGKGWILFTL